jgi:hypothetical protein
VRNWGNEEQRKRDPLSYYFNNSKDWVFDANEIKEM